MNYTLHNYYKNTRGIFISVKSELLAYQATWGKMSIACCTNGCCFLIDLSFNIPTDSLYKLNRTEQVIQFRLRTRHNRLNAHMYNKFKVGESEMCPCKADVMTAEHLLQHCRLHDAVRRDTWPEPTHLWDKLYGNLEEQQASPSSVRRRRRSIPKR